MSANREPPPRFTIAILRKGKVVKTAPAEGTEQAVERAALQLMLWEAGDDYAIMPIAARTDKA